MASEDEEYDGGYKTIYGVDFKQPNSRNFGLNEESITDDPMYMLIAVVGVIPYIGLIFSLAGLAVAYASRHDNSFCIDEQLCKAGVIGGALQAIVLSILLLLYLVV